MIYRAYTPGPPVCHFVECLWYGAGYHRVAHSRERVLPSGCSQLLINLRSESPESSGCVIAGVQPGHVVIETAWLAELMGVVFRPGGAVAVLGAPAHHFTGLDVELCLFWGRRAEEVRYRLLEAADISEKFRVLEARLAAELLETSGHRLVRAAVREFDTIPQIRSIAEMSRQSGLSSRRFIDVFRHHVGLTPKVYCRLRRFHRVVERVARGHCPNWASVAADCGYFDQSHLIRDFRAFSGLTPTEFAGHPGAWATHVPLPD